VISSSGKVVWWMGVTEMRENNGEDLYSIGESGEKRGNSDLKAGHVRA
jgi:hypothetical protein